MKRSFFPIRGWMRPKLMFFIGLALMGCTHAERRPAAKEGAEPSGFDCKPLLSGGTQASIAPQGVELQLIQQVADGIHLDKAGIGGGVYGEQAGFRDFLINAIQVMLKGMKEGKSIDSILIEVTHLRVLQVEKDERQSTIKSHGASIEQGALNSHVKSIGKAYSLDTDVPENLLPSQGTASHQDSLNTFGPPQVSATSRKTIIASGEISFSYSVGSNQKGNRRVQGQTIRRDGTQLWNGDMMLLATSAPEASQKDLFRDSLDCFQLEIAGTNPSRSRAETLEKLYDAYHKFIVSMPTRRGTATLGDLLLATAIYHKTGKILPPPMNGIRRDSAALALSQDEFIQFMTAKYSEFLK